MYHNTSGELYGKREKEAYRITKTLTTHRSKQVHSSKVSRLLLQIVVYEDFVSFSFRFSFKENINHAPYIKIFSS